MKLRIRDRILSAFMGLLIIAGSAFALIKLLRGTVSGWQLWAGIAICIFLVYIGLCGIMLLFRRRREKGVVMQHTEYGDVSISMKAMENMVRKCVDAHPELNVNQTRITHSRSGICVDIKITLMTGANIPLTVNALQKQVKQYITSCSGIDVEEIRVMVETEAAKRLPAPEHVEMPPEVPVVVEETTVQPVEKAGECLCHHQEEPSTYAEKDETAPQEEMPAEIAEASEEEVSEKNDETVEEAHA